MDSLRAVAWKVLSTAIRDGMLVFMGVPFLWAETLEV